MKPGCGWRANGTGFIRCRRTPSPTCAASAGREAIDAMNIWPHRTGTIVHDGFPTDDAYPGPQARCHAHHERALAATEDVAHQEGVAPLKTLFSERNETTRAARAAEQFAVDPVLRAVLTTRYDALIQTGLAQNPAQWPQPPPRICGSAWIPSARRGSGSREISPSRLITTWRSATGVWSPCGKRFPEPSGPRRGQRGVLDSGVSLDGTQTGSIDGGRHPVGDHRKPVATHDLNGRRPFNTALGSCASWPRRIPGDGNAIP